MAAFTATGEKAVLTAEESQRLNADEQKALLDVRQQYNNAVASGWSQDEINNAMTGWKEEANGIRNNASGGGFYTNYDGTYAGDVGGGSVSRTPVTGPTFSQAEDYDFASQQANVSNVQAQQPQNQPNYTLEDINKLISQGVSSALGSYNDSNTEAINKLIAQLNTNNNSYNDKLLALNAQLAELQKTPTAYFTWDDYWKNRDAYINNMTKSPTTYINWDDYWNRLNSYIEDGKTAAINANQAATDKSVLDVNATLQNGLPQYAQVADDAYLKKMAAESNNALNAQAAGDIGGLYQRQYGYTDSAYDQQLLGIALEKQNFINQCNQQIDALKAQGRYNEAQLISDWANTRIQMYDQAINNVYSINQNQQQIDQSTVNSYNNLIESMYGINQNQQQIDLGAYQWDKNFAYNKAIELLDKGFVTAESLVNLGVMPSEAQSYANYINQLRNTNLASAQAELANLLAKTQSGALGGSSGGTGTGTPNSTPALNTKGTFGYSSGAFDKAEEQTLREALASGTLQVQRNGTVYTAKAYDNNKSVSIGGKAGWQNGDIIKLSGEQGSDDGAYVYQDGKFITLADYKAKTKLESDLQTSKNRLQEWASDTMSRFGIDGEVYQEEGDLGVYKRLESQLALYQSFLSKAKEEAASKNNLAHATDLTTNKTIEAYVKKINDIESAMKEYKNLKYGL